MVLDVDTRQQRLSLGLKASYFLGANDEDGEGVDEVCPLYIHSMLHLMFRV